MKINISNVSKKGHDILLEYCIKGGGYKVTSFCKFTAQEITFQTLSGLKQSGFCELIHHTYCACSYGLLVMGKPFIKLYPIVVPKLVFQVELKTKG